MCEAWGTEYACGKDGTAPAKKDLRDIRKNHRAEFDLLMQYHDALAAGLGEGHGLEYFSRSRYKSEPKGFLAIRLNKSNLKKLRLYVYLDLERKKIILLCAGGKDPRKQTRDINQAKELLERYRNPSSGGHA